MFVDIFNTDKKYGIIYADPPWKYELNRVEGAAERHYGCMELEDLKRLPVQRICAKDCLLFMWVTYPFLKEGLQLIESWGFKYRTCAFVWLKKNRKSQGWYFGIGFWTRSNSEICLLARKGKPKRASNRVHQFIESPITEHSRKPDEAREKIVELCGDLPRIELFARTETEGWDCWGNEVSGQGKSEEKNGEAHHEVQLP